MPLAASAASTVEGLWVEICGENDDLVQEVTAEANGLQLRAFANTLRPGGGPWSVQPAHGTVRYPPAQPMVQLDERFATGGTVTETDEGLRFELDVSGRSHTIVVRATYAPMAAGAECQ